MIHRGSSQIGGCCTQISTGESRILIDFGANLPGTDQNAGIKDSEMFQKVFGSVWKGAVLFTHYHGDHYGLFKEIPDDVPMYIGSLAKDILEILVPYMDRGAEKKGLPAVERMRTYEAGIWITPVPGIRSFPSTWITLPWILICFTSGFPEKASYLPGIFGNMALWARGDA